MKKCDKDHFFSKELEKCPFCMEENNKNKQNNKPSIEENSLINPPFFSFLKNKRFYFHFVLASITTVLLFFIWLKSIDYSTLHGKEFKLKNYQSINVNELDKLSEQDNIEFIISDTVFTDSVPKGTVFIQDPLPNTYVKNGRKVYLTINSQNTQKFFVPDVFNKSGREAIVNLTKHFKIILIKDASYSEESSVVISLKVRGDEIFAGQELLKGTPITVIFGSGRNMNTILVPDLIGAHYILAKSILNELYLKIGEVSFEGIITDSSFVVVVKQYPTFERYLQEGDEVDLYFRQIPDTTQFIE